MYGLVKLAASQNSPFKENKERSKEKEKVNRVVYNYLKKNYPEDCLQWAKSVDWSLQAQVPLEKVKMARRPGGARERDKVKGISEAVKNGEYMEPVVLVKLYDGTYKIADGYHRTLGFRNADKKTIKAWVAAVPEDRGPWDKEMHEKKLNVGDKKPGMKKTAGLFSVLKK